MLFTACMQPIVVVQQVVVGRFCWTLTIIRYDVAGDTCIIFSNSWTFSFLLSTRYFSFSRSNLEKKMTSLDVPPLTIIRSEVAGDTN